MAIQQTSHPDDSTWHGDPPLLLSDPSVVQVLFKNVNGLIKGDDSSGYDEWRQTGGVDMHQRGLNILGFAETNTKMTTQRKEALKSNLTAPHCKMQTSSSNIPCSTRYLPGGTLTLVDSSLSMYVRGQGSDPSGMGRWSWIRLQRLGLPDLIIVTAYRVCNSNNGHAKQTAYLQQCSHSRIAQCAIPGKLSSWTSGDSSGDTSNKSTPSW